MSISFIQLTVTDCRTDLVWLKKADCFGLQNWNTAMSSAAELNNGECGLSDGSSEGDWRLPTIEELQRIGTDPPVTWEGEFPLVKFTSPSGFFTFVTDPMVSYWSGTEINTEQALVILIIIEAIPSAAGATGPALKDSSGNYVWPVR